MYKIERHEEEEKEDENNKQKRKHLYPDTLSHSFISTISFFLFGSLLTDRENLMTPGINYSLDPLVCSCFPTYLHMMCNQIKWSTISINIALICDPLTQFACYFSQHGNAIMM